MKLQRDAGPREGIPPDTPHSNATVRRTDGFVLSCVLDVVAVPGAGESAVLCRVGGRGDPVAMQSANPRRVVRYCLLHRLCSTESSTALGLFIRDAPYDPEHLWSQLPLDCCYGNLKLDSSLDLCLAALISAHLSSPSILEHHAAVPSCVPSAC